MFRLKAALAANVATIASGLSYAPRLTFFMRSRSRQTSGCGSEGPLNSGEPSYDGNL